MRRLATVVALAIVGGSIGAEPSPGGAGAANLLPNPSFELVEPPLPTADTAVAGGVTPPETWLPRTWSVGADGGALWRCPDAPDQAHSGRRCAAATAKTGSGWLRYGPVPAHRPGPWTVRVWARGTGQLVVGAYTVLPDRWARLPAEQPLTLTAEWTLCQAVLQLPPTCQRWMLDLATRGPTEAWLDDVSVTCPDLPTIPLPPTAAVDRDADTLLYLPFEEPPDPDAFFVRGGVHLTEAAAGPGPSDRAGQGRFGRALALGADGYIAGSANENLDPARGTIEFWVRLLSPGNDGVYRPLLSVPGPDGMVLGKDQYSHISLSFSNGWQTLSRAWADGYAWRWQPGVWRHLAACWDQDALQVFVDGKLVAWTEKPKLPRALGPELRIGSPDLELDDLRISRTVRYRAALPPPPTP